MQTPALGRSVPTVSAQGLGGMGMGANHGAPGDPQDMIAVLHAAVTRGVTLFDTADVYGH